jgi:acyl-CoA thioester hydrolase
VTTFTYPITVQPTDIDHMGHVNNAVYLRWIQEVVIAFWQSRAPTEAVPQYLWIALEHTIRYLRPGFLGDPLRAEMVAERTAGARAYFSARVMNGATVLAEISSCWCALDSATHRPRRIAAEVVAHVFMRNLAPMQALSG